MRICKKCKGKFVPKRPDMVFCCLKCSKHYSTPKQRLKWKITSYGISVDDYNEMFAKQEGRCAICKRHQSEFNQRLHIDHDHTTKEVRGLLCYNCNRGLGMFCEDVTSLKEAVEYLETHKKPSVERRQRVS